MAQSPEATEETRLGPVRMLRAVFSGVGQLLLAADRFRKEETDRLQAETQATGAAPDGTRPLDGEPARPRLLKITGSAEPSSHTAKPAKDAKAAKSVKSRSVRSTASGSTDGASRKPAKAGSSAAKRASRKTATAPQPRFRSLDSTGNVRVLTDQDIADLAEDEFDRSERDRGRRTRPTMTLTEVTSLPSFPTPAPPRAESGESFGPGPGSTFDAGPASTFSPGPGGIFDGRPKLPIADYDGLSIASLRARLRGLEPTQLRQLADYEASHANRADVVTMFENRITKLESIGES